MVVSEGARACRIAANVLLLVVGLVLLTRAADAFVVGAARLAANLGVSPLVVGAVVVGFGTSAPELLVSSVAAAGGSLDLAVGNVVGSNMANLTLVLGVAGIIARPAIQPRIVRREAPLSFGAVALFALAVQGGLSRREGVLLLVVMVVALAGVLHGSRRRLDGPDVRTAQERGPAGPADGSVRRDVVRVFLGLVGTVAGAQLLVTGAQRIAEDIGLSGGFVGLTLVAVGTSLPELVTAIQAARRHETALLAGNVLGSNIFNSTAVAGAAALVGPGPLTDPGLTVVATLSMVAIAALAWLFLGLGGRLRRVEGLILLAVYLVTIPFLA